MIESSSYFQLQSWMIADTTYRVVRTSEPNLLVTIVMLDFKSLIKGYSHDPIVFVLEVTRFLEDRVTGVTMYIHIPSSVKGQVY
jgi:hypothetical protein